MPKSGPVQVWLNRKFVYITEVRNMMRKRVKYNVLKCFGGVYGKYNNKGSFIGVLYVTSDLSAVRRLSVTRSKLSGHKSSSTILSKACLVFRFLVASPWKDPEHRPEERRNDLECLTVIGTETSDHYCCVLKTALSHKINKLHIFWSHITKY